MVTTPERAAQILNQLAEELQRRATDVQELDRAYRGDFRLNFASDSFRDYFADRYARFSDNWCGIVADAPHERLEVTGIRLPGQESGDSGLFDHWRLMDADQGSDLALLEAIIAKRSFGLVWGDDGNISFEHPSQAIVGYDPETRARVAGAKLWADDATEYATLYLPHEVWKFQRPRVSSGGGYASEVAASPIPGGWVPREGVEPWMRNPMGKVPLVELRNRPQLLGEPLSDISGTLAMQHAINLLWAELFAVADEATIGQRVILGAEQPMMPILDEQGEIIGEKPVDLKKLRHSETLWVEDTNAKLGEWSRADLKVFTDVVEIAVGHIAAQTRTPAHYLLIGGTIANVSGDAMKALETGLVKRTEEKTQHFGRGVRDLFELVALAKGDTRQAEACRGGVVLWKDVENRSDAQRADALLKKSQIGYPLQYLMEQDGLPPQEIARVMAMVRAEQADPTLEAIVAKARSAGGSGAAASGA